MSTLARAPSSEGYQTQDIAINVVAGESTELSVVLQAARAKVSAEKIEILEKVFFDTNKTTIKPESFPLLDEVSALLVAHPDITLVRVEGHTDARGSATTNRRLSQGRADSVRQYLIDHGVAAERLIAQGFGEDAPLVEGNSEAAWEQNRRVEFMIVQRTPPAEQP